MSDEVRDGDGRAVSLAQIARTWTFIGCVGFGGPPAHIALLRRRVVAENGWMSAEEFEDGIAAVNLLPGPASTQLAIFSAWRLAGNAGALVGGLGFICPGLVVIIALAALFLAHHPPSAVLGAAAGAGAAVPAVALAAAWGLAPASWRRVGSDAGARVRFVGYAAAGAAAAATIGPYLAIVILFCGLLEVRLRRVDTEDKRALLIAALGHLAVGGLGALCWVAFKVGALSYGGGFVIVPLMQHDAVATYHWMTGSQFLNAVALGQVTPGPVVLTVGVVGYAAHGVAGALLAVAVAFAPSFAFVIFGAPYFARLRRSATIQSFLTGAGPCVVGAIGGAAVALGLEITHLWQIPVLAGALVWLFALRRGVVSTLLFAGVVGALVALSGVAP